MGLEFYAKNWAQLRRESILKKSEKQCYFEFLQVLKISQKNLIKDIAGVWSYRQSLSITCIFEKVMINKNLSKCDLTRKTNLSCKILPTHSLVIFLISSWCQKQFHVKQVRIFQSDFLAGCSWNWLLILMPATVSQILKSQQVQKLKI